MSALDSLVISCTAIRNQRPLVHNITNYVVMNTTANALLALGASPVMAHAPEEMEEMVTLAGALVINIGTLDKPWITAMEKALTTAAARGKPVILDPVGVGATTFRTRTALSLAMQNSPAIIRGNASEILALTNARVRTKGVDSDRATEEALEAGRMLAREFQCVVVISGAVDLVIGPESLARIANGDPLMSRVTGFGCTASALCGAFAAVQPDPFAAAVQAMLVMGVTGEKAACKAAGPGTLQTIFFDLLYQLTPEEIRAAARLDETPLA